MCFSIRTGRKNGGMNVIQVIYTADDEEPDCNRCCHCDCDEIICTDRCGPDHGWFGYERIEYEEE